MEGDFFDPNFIYDFVLSVHNRHVEIDPSFDHLSIFERCDI